uniref:Uncharacterized protein n=1 Tax=Arundo donax TaxID=35708 RepID=A0A0A8Y7G3_ARUDO
MSIHSLSLSHTHVVGIFAFSVDIWGLYLRAKAILLELSREAKVGPIHWTC